ncbi:MAG: DUF512 domain-containing protein [Fibrobacter sp.]|nr:DUF512 domain-containing protein [Fibrobacter sp.]
MRTGLKVRMLPKKSPFFKAGLRTGDLITKINNQEISDELDFRFYAAVDILEIIVNRNGAMLAFTVIRDEGSFLDLEFYEQKINRCCNHCVFCFIDQMPRGLRRGLYIKDEDFKHSFLNGNYVTLSGASIKDLQKVADLGISPLYISVHATDKEVRNRMLGNLKAPPVIEQLEFLKRSGIFFHTQIVVCRGYNDGEVLKKTIGDLFRFGSALLSIAVVPVGLTKFRKKHLDPIDKGCAVQICDTVLKVGDAHAVRDGVRKLFAADELFIKAGMPIPPRKYYCDYPQIENGVGLVRQLFEEWKVCRKQLNSTTVKVSGKNTLVVTSVSAFPFLKKIADQLKKDRPQIQVSVVSVVNTFFGDSVTVAGLLTAKDVLKVVKRCLKEGDYKRVVVPAVMFNYAGHTLDGYSVSRIAKVLGVPVKAAGSILDMVAG